MLELVSIPLLIAAAYCDLRYKTIPVFIPLAVLAVAMANLIVGFSVGLVFGFLFGGFLIVLMAILPKKFASQIGGGDFKLLASLSCLLGFPAFAWFFLLSIGVHLLYVRVLKGSWKAHSEYAVVALISMVFLLLF